MGLQFHYQRCFIAEPVNYILNATVDVGDVNDNCPVFVEPVNISSKLNRTECFICLSPYNAYNIKPFHKSFINTTRKCLEHLIPS